MSNRRKHTGIPLLAVLFCLATLQTQSAKPVSLSSPTDDRAAMQKNLLQGLVMHMTFDKDESGQTRITDESGNGNHGKPVGVRWTPDGKIGGAYEFRSDGQAIVVPNNPSINPAKCTLSAWIKTTTRDSIWRRIFDKSYKLGYAVSVAADYNGNNWSGLVSLEIGPGEHFSLTRTMVADGAWHQVVATFDGTEQILYVDGRPQRQPLQWNIPGPAGVSTYDLNIGCNRSNVGEPDFGTSFRGMIDEPMMWNRALSVSEVARLYESQK
jgi:hypothetical protein